MDKVAVLMSTYNGEKYLNEQIDSILAQDGVDVILYIRDDGSSDRTAEIIKDYCNRYNNISFTQGENLGVGNSFMQLVYDSGDEHDYYAFADQDDVWDVDKIKKAIELIGDSGGPMLYGSNQELIDKNKNKLGLRYSRKYSMPIQLESIFQTNQISGCTFVFNRELKILLSEEKRRPSKGLLKNRIHDVWVANVAALYNGIVYDDTPHIKYRQHESNVIGAYTYGVIFSIKDKLRKFRNPLYRNGRSLISNELCRTFPEKTVEHPLIYCCRDGLTLDARKYLLRNIGKLKEYTNETYLGLVLKICIGIY